MFGCVEEFQEPNDCQERYQCKGGIHKTIVNVKRSEEDGDKKPCKNEDIQLIPIVRKMLFQLLLQRHVKLCDLSKVNKKFVHD